jgi:hypothetical protein
MALYYDLPVFKDVYRLTLRIFELTRHFSREYKFTLGQDMKHDCLVLEAQDGAPLLTYQKQYPLFRHVTQDEALQRSLRNIKQDLAGEFTNEVRRIAW